MQHRRALLVAALLGALALSVSGQVSFGNIAVVNAVGKWPGNADDDWYDSFMVCNLVNEQKYYFKTTMNPEFSFTGREEIEDESGLSTWQWIAKRALSAVDTAVQGMIRTWNYVLKVDEDGDTLQMWENIVIDVHLVIDSDYIVRRCCWYESSRWEHPWCLSPDMAADDNVGAGIDGTTKYRYNPINDNRGLRDAMSLGIPYENSPCYAANNVVPGSRLAAIEAETREALNAPIFRKIEGGLRPRLEALAREPTRPPGFKDIAEVDLHVDDEGLVVRIDFVDEDDGVVFYEEITRHTTELPENYNDPGFREPPAILDTQEKCTNATGLQLTPPDTSVGPTWLAALAVSSVIGAALLGLCYAQHLRTREADQDGMSTFGGFPGAGASTGSRMSGKSGMTRGDMFGNASAGTRATGTSNFTRGSSFDEDVVVVGGAGNRMTGASAFTRGGGGDFGDDESFVTDGTRPGDRMTGISGFTRGGGGSGASVGGQSFVSNGTRSKGSRRSKGSKHSKRSKGSLSHKSHGSRSSKGSRHGSRAKMKHRG